jgi:alkylation response protein AidB-like acyl-CoA dehydrogenase
MNFDPEDDPPDIAAFRVEVRALLEETFGPGPRFPWSANWSTRKNEDEYEFRRLLARTLGEKGWLFPMFPPEYGGGGLTARHQLVVEGEVALRGLQLSLVYYTLAFIAAPCILHWGTEQQRQDFLPGLTGGTVITWQLLTEPQGGSDIANCRTKAIRDGDHYIVNGQKIMVGSTHSPDFLWTLVCTDPQGARHQNLSWIYIPASLPGITIIPLPMMMGIKNSVFFDDVAVPEQYLVGGENNGWRVSTTHLEIEHGGGGSVMGDTVVDRLFDRCLQPVGPDGQRLIDDPDVRSTLADAFIDAHAVDLLGLRNFWHATQGEPHDYGGAQYMYATRMLKLNTARRMQQILGYDGLLEDLTVDEVDDFQYAIRRGPGELHGAGTLDTDRVVIARRLGLGRADAETAPTTI